MKFRIYKIGFVNLNILRPWLFVFLFMVFSGAIRKWVVDSSIISNMFFGIQLFIPLFLTFQLRHYRVRFPYTRFFQFYILLLVFLSFHPLNLTFGHGILGFLLFTSVWFILYAYLKIRKQMPVERLDVIVLIVLCLELILAYMQYYSPADHIINKYAQGSQDIASVGDAIRTTGTFSYISGLSSLIIFWGFFSWYALLHHKNIWLVIFIITGGAVCSFFTGSRSTVLIYFALLFMGMVSSGFFAKYYFKISTVAVFIGYLYLIFPHFFVFDVINHSFSNFEERYDSGVESGEMDSRIESQYFGAFNYHGNHPIFGVGLGSTYQGAIALFGESSYVADYGYYEEEGERIVIEGGYVLYFFRLIIFGLFLSVLNMPMWCKIVIFLLFVNSIASFNIYLSFFFAFGLIWVDRAFFLRNISKKIKNNLK